MSLNSFDPTRPPTSGDVLSLEHRDNYGGVNSLLFAEEGTIDGGFIRGFLARRTGVTTLSISPGKAWVNITGNNKKLVEKLTATTLDISTSGVANGLDTGTVSTDTLYYIYLIVKDSDQTVDFLFSISSTTPTLPSGYSNKRLIDSWFRGDATIGLKFGYTLGIGNFRKRVWVGAWADPTAGSLFSIENGNSTTLITLDLSTLGGIPPANVGTNLIIYPSDSIIKLVRNSVSQRWVALSYDTVYTGEVVHVDIPSGEVMGIEVNMLLFEKSIKYQLEVNSFNLYLGVYSYTFNC